MTDRTYVVVKRDSYKNKFIVVDKETGRILDDAQGYGYKTVRNAYASAKRAGNSLHPNEKNVDLIEFFIKIATNEGDTVLDFTMGSGTTGVACKNLNRKFIGIELDKGYFDIACKRIEEGK